MLGRVVEFESHFDRHRPEEPPASASKWKNKVIPGGGAIYDLGAHLLDQAVQLFGLPAKVTGFVGSQRAHNISGFDDSFTVLLHYGNGLLVTAKAGVVSPVEEQLRFWVRGEKGSYKKVSSSCEVHWQASSSIINELHFILECSSILIFKKDNLKLVLSPVTADMQKSLAVIMVGFFLSFYSCVATATNTLPGSLTTIQNGKPVKQVYPTAKPPTYVEYYQKIAGALSGKNPLPASGKEARDVIRIIELVKESSDLGKTLDV